jgi:hypothetical protein
MQVVVQDVPQHVVEPPGASILTRTASGGRTSSSPYARCSTNDSLTTFRDVALRDIAHRSFRACS